MDFINNNNNNGKQTVQQQQQQQQQYKQTNSHDGKQTNKQKQQLILITYNIITMMQAISFAAAQVFHTPSLLLAISKKTSTSAIMVIAAFAFVYDIYY